MRIPVLRPAAAGALTLIAGLFLTLPLAGCGSGSGSGKTIATPIPQPSCECERPRWAPDLPRTPPPPELQPSKKEKKVEADSERFEGKERVCRYGNNVVIRVALPKPCPTF